MVFNNILLFRIDLFYTRTWELKVSLPTKKVVFDLFFLSPEMRGTGIFIDRI